MNEDTLGHQSLSASRDDAPPVPMLCFPPEGLFGQVVRLEDLPALMRRHQVAVRCVSEFAIGLREPALMGQGAAWLPGSLIADDLRRGRLKSLEALGRSVAMDIVAFFAVRSGIDTERKGHLDATFDAIMCCI